MRHYYTAFRGVNPHSLDTAKCRVRLLGVGKQPGRFIDGATWKRARKRFGLTQKAAADLCGVDETTVQNWEGGRTLKVRRIYLEKLREGAKPKP